MAYPRRMGKASSGYKSLNGKSAGFRRLLYTRSKEDRYQGKKRCRPFERTDSVAFAGFIAACPEYGGISFRSDILAEGAMEFFLNFALLLNLFILLLSLAPVHYFHGEVKGLETDGLQIIHALKRNMD